MEVAIQILIVGVLATVAIDIWATFANKMFKLPRTNWAMVGRWLGHIPSGKFTHISISSSPTIKYENTVGWVFHYSIGLSYAALYIGLVFTFLDGIPTLLSAWVFGLVTILSPWFVMQPCLGMGVCAVKAPEPNLVRINNFIIHSIFGIALYCGWIGINEFLYLNHV
ncbi:MAG: DUF2938 domain-containing protein [Pseudomonadales bacterium]|nr:DUF2938 domain-containing protein [Pseudomonadales bacterium]